MSGTLSELFAIERASIVEWDGAPLYAVYEFAPVPQSMTVEFMGSRSSPVQGVEFRMRGGLLCVNGVEADSIVLWRDSAPSMVSIEIRALPDAEASLKLWNVWRHASGVKHAWIGNAGMRVELAEEAVRLRCSDGEGPANFDDLEMLLRTTNSA